MRLIIGLYMEKYSVYSRPHFDGTCAVCDNDNPIKVRAMHFYLPGSPVATWSACCSELN